MDRRNGGTSLAPPRPPKSLPRVHRPRAPDPNSNNASLPVPSTAMIGMMVVGNGATGTGGHLQQQQQQHPATSPPTQPPQLSPKPRHLIGGSVSSSSSSNNSSSSSVVLGSNNLSNGNDNSSNLARNNISSNSNNNISNNNINSNNNNNNTIFMNNNPHNHTAVATMAPSGDSNFNSASLISSNGSSSRSNSSTSSTSNSTSTSSRSNHSNLNNNSSSSSSSTGGNNARNGSSQHHQHHQPPHLHHHPSPTPPPPHPHHHQHNHPHQQSNRSIGSNSSTLSSVSSSSSTVALLRPHQIAPLVPLHSRSATPPPPPLPPHQRPTSPAGSVSGNSTGSTFARRRLSPATTNPPSLHHPHLTSIPLGSGNEPTATSGGAPPVLLLPVDQPIVPANNNTNASNPTTPVTLAAPRPENERLANEYVDTPFGRSHNNGTTIGGGGVPNIPSTGGLVPGLQQTINQQHRNLSLLVAGDTVVVPVITGQPRPTVDRTRSPIIGIGGNSDAIRVVKSTEGRHGITTTTTTTTGTVGQPLTNASSIARGSSIITKQPTKKKDGSDRHELLELELQHHHHHHHHRHHGRSAIATVGGTSPGALGTAGVPGSDGLMGIGSITCPRCRRCRCEECQKPRPLPSHWLCDKSCLCSAETIIDYASCLCCVKALYYHCSKEHEFEREVIGPDGTIETETVSCADDPCSCVPHKRTTRWGCLGALSVALPCLWCYWPMRGCVAICARCYAKHSRHGCRCTQHPAIPAGSNNAGGILNGSMFGTELIGGPGGGGVGGGGLHTAGLHGHELRTKGDPADGDSTLQHLHHQLRHHLHHQHRSVDASSNDLTTPEKRLLDTSTDTSY
ncbi:protein sprouty [Anopheles funestus]|uniref:protein sprouty n=1 Tax=Anopheles funestus TaxID=62324 RepID=UPI0020C7135B|nr:protein sprouty [Anopheles funestus]XP_049296003.1 protein sprouty [Anopheles funestus]